MAVNAAKTVGSAVADGAKVRLNFMPIATIATRAALAVLL
jgi:hypothetical protein